MTLYIRFILQMIYQQRRLHSQLNLCYNGFIRNSIFFLPQYNWHLWVSMIKERFNCDCDGAVGLALYLFEVLGSCDLQFSVSFLLLVMSWFDVQSFSPCIHLFVVQHLAFHLHVLSLILCWRHCIQSNVIRIIDHEV